MNACGDGVHVGRNRPCFQLLPMGDVPTATQLSNADMEWLDFAWYLGIEESEYVDLMYHLQHSRGDDIFNIFQHEDLDDDDNLDDIDNVPYIADDEDDLSDIEEEEEPGPGGEIGFNRDLDDNNNVMDGESEERSRDLGQDFEESTNRLVGWWSHFDDTDGDSDADNDRDTNNAAVVEEDPRPGGANSRDPDDGRTDENTQGDGANSGDSCNPNNADSGHSTNEKAAQNCPGRDAGSAAEEETLPCSSRKRSREADEQEASCSKRFRWCSEFDDQDGDSSSDEGDFSDPNSAGADSGHGSNVRSCQNRSSTEEESPPSPSKKRSREANDAGNKQLRSLNGSEVVVEEDPWPGRSRSPYYSDCNAGSEVAVAEELPSPDKVTSRHYEQDSGLARRSKLFKSFDQSVDSDSDGDMVHGNVPGFCHPNSADVFDTPTPPLRHAGSDGSVDAEEEPLSALSKVRSREQNKGSNKRFSCFIEFSDSDSDSDAGGRVSSAAVATEHPWPGNTRSDGNMQCDGLHADHTNSRASSDSNSSGSGRNTLNHPDRPAGSRAVVAEKELPALSKTRFREDNEGSTRRLRWLIEFDVADGDTDSGFSAAVVEEEPVPGYTYNQADGLNTDHASSRASSDPTISGAGSTDDHPFRNTHCKSGVAEEDAPPALSWKRSRVVDSEYSDTVSSKRVRWWCNEFDDQDSDGGTDTTNSEYSRSRGSSNKNFENPSVRNAAVAEEEFLPSATRKRSRERDEQDSEASSSKQFRSCHELDGAADTGHYSNNQYGAEAELRSAPFKKRRNRTSSGGAMSSVTLTVLTRMQK